MAEDDIYGNKRRYERYVSRLDELSNPPEPATKAVRNGIPGRNANGGRRQLTGKLEPAIRGNFSSRLC